MRSLAWVIAAAVLGGCSLLSLAPQLDRNALDYHEVVEDVTNNILVTNILRARDRAPLHYSDLSIIRGSVQAGAAAQATIPFGNLNAATDRKGLQLGNISIQSAPNFDLGTLDTNDFTHGILTPISGETIKYFLDQGLDPRIAFIVFFEGIKGYAAELRLRDGIVVVRPGDKVNNSPDKREDFNKFMTIANHEASGLYANAYQELHPIGQQFKIDLRNAYKEIKEIAALDFSKVQVRQTERSGLYALYAIAPGTRVTFCRYLNGERSDASVIEDSSRGRTKDKFKVFGVARTRLPTLHPSQVCTATEVILDAGAGASEVVLYPRSAQGIIEYLGALLRLEQARGRPITLTAAPDSPVLFSLMRQPENARFSVEYRGEQYYVPAASDRNYTLPILALVNQLFNLYKSGKDIPTTRTVNIVP